MARWSCSTRLPKVAPDAVPAVFVQNPVSLELHDCGWVSPMAIGVDDPRRRMVLSAQGFGQKAFGRLGVLFGREQKIQGGARGIYGAIEIAPFAFDPHVRLVD